MGVSGIINRHKSHLRVSTLETVLLKVVKPIERRTPNELYKSLLTAFYNHKYSNNDVGHLTPVFLLK